MPNFGRKRVTALQRVDLAAFMDRIIVMAPMVPTSTMFTFPSTFTIRKSLAAASGVLSAGVVPDSIGVAPSGAWRESWKPAIAPGQTCQGRRTKQDVLGEDEVAGIFVDLAAREPSPTNVTYLLVLKNMLVYCRRRTLREEGSASMMSDSLYPYSLTALSRKQTRPG